MNSISPPCSIARPRRAWRCHHGSALLLVLWAVAVLSLTIVGVVQITGYSLDETLAQKRAFQARLLAQSGLAFALEPQIQKFDPVLSQSVGSDGRFKVHYSSEAGRLQINFLLAAGRRDVLRTLFLRWGLSPAEADEVIDSLLDWVSINGVRQIQGMGANDAAVGQGNDVIHPLQSIEEMADVLSMNIVAEKHPHWRDTFTVWTDGKVDVNDASPDVIEAIGGVSISQAERFCDYRLGPDLTANTEDDLRYVDFNQVRARLGLSEAAFEKVAPWITLDSKIRRIESVGSIGSFEHRIVIVAPVGTIPQIYLEWREF